MWPIAGEQDQMSLFAGNILKSMDGNELLAN
jgi:hypothetical protein